MAKARKQNRYSALVERVFTQRYSPGDTEVPFPRKDLTDAAAALGIELPKNLGDVLYSFRFRSDLPPAVAKTAPVDMTWAIKLAGRAQYRFHLVPETRITPNKGMVVTKIPDATPEIIATNTLGDEQAVLARIRYNRLVDIFLGVTAYSLQNHLRTTVAHVGQVEIDEIYVAVDRHGAQYVVPVQAKGGTDQLGVVQTEQDLACCAEKFPSLRVRAVAAQFLPRGIIALFELAVQNDEVRVVQERHYQLVRSEEIDDAELALYRQVAATAQM
jgi:hypothetical protein